MEPLALFGLRKAVFVKVIWWIIVMKSMLFTSILLLSFQCLSHIFSFTLCLSPFHCDAYRLRLIPACLHRTSSKHHHIMKRRRCRNAFRFIPNEDLSEERTNMLSWENLEWMECIYHFFQLPAPPVHISVDVLKQPTLIIQSTSWLSQLDIAISVLLTNAQFPHLSA